MTDAEKMREAAAHIADLKYSASRDALALAEKAGDGPQITVACVALMRQAGEISAKIRALPIPDASAAAADCQQAGLVTVEAGLLDNLRRENSELKDQIVSLNIAAGMTDTLEAGLHEEIALLRAERLSPALLDEVKAALRAAEDALADSQWSGGSAERRVSAALARLEREVG